MSAKHVILGLVIKQPNYVKRIAMNARQLLQSADLAVSYPYWALEKLTAEELVRQVYENDAPAGQRGHREQPIYEATAQGIQAFEDWLGSTPDEYSLRDDVLFRFTVAPMEHVPRIIELIRDRERVCSAREQTLKQHRPARPGDRFDWDSAVSDVASQAELTYWRGRIGWLQGMREALEAISAERSEN